MAWFLSAFIIGSLLYLITPARLPQLAEQSHTMGIAAVQRYKLLLILPLLVLGWLLSRMFEEQFSFFSLASIGFVMTSLTLLIPSWRNWVLPSALLSVIAVLLGVLFG